VPDYAFFWGCQIPARFPFLEKSTRLVLDRLKVRYRDIDGFTCCPPSIAIENLGNRIWLAAAVRNLAVAEREGLDLLTVCNGCYSTLRRASSVLQSNRALKDEINERLSKFGLSYQGRIGVRHLVEVLYDEVSPDAIRRNVEKPFHRMNVAAHYGCDLLRPSTQIRFDDPINPTKFDQLIEATGARSIDYETKMMCCGGMLSEMSDEKEALMAARKKLSELCDLKVDAMCVCCPSCFIQYDARQTLLRASGDDYNIPVIYYTELLCLAMGIPPEEVGVSKHAVKNRPFLAKWESLNRAREEAGKYFDVQFLQKCYDCKACIEDCPTAKTLDSYDPNHVIGRVLDGKLEEVLESKDIWRCLECYTCYELCPHRVGMVSVFSRLKELATARGLAPYGIKAAQDSFRKNGALAEVVEISRKRLGLPPSKRSGTEELLKLLEDLEKSPHDG
jgi:CoB--CoM heterodisulfide reductase subunit B